MAKRGGDPGGGCRFYRKFDIITRTIVKAEKNSGSKRDVKSGGGRSYKSGGYRGWRIGERRNHEWTLMDSNFWRKEGRKEGRKAGREAGRQGGIV